MATTVTPVSENRQSVKKSPRQVFDRHALPPARSFYEKELGRLTRPSRGWALGCCPFHESKSKKSFSVHLDSGGFYCFGCGAKGGNVLDFLILRYGMNFTTAAGTLGALRDLTAETRREIQEAESQREKIRRQEAEIESARRQERFEARDSLHALETLYQESSDRLAELCEGQAEQVPGEAEFHWETMAELLPKIRAAETRYWQSAEMEVRHEN